MSWQTFRPTLVVGGALVVGGLLTILFPQHVPTILRLVIVTAAAGAAIHALTRTAPRAWWTSPFDRRSGSGRTRPESHELTDLRAALSGRRQAVDGGPPLPPETLRVLQPLIEVASERGGVDPGTPAEEGGFSEVTRAVHRSEPLMWPRWYRTRRPDPGRVAETVVHVLDDLERRAAS